MDLSAAVRVAPAESHPAVVAWEADLPLTERGVLGVAITCGMGLLVLYGLSTLAAWLGEDPSETERREPRERRRHE